MDYAALRQEGIRLLERMTGGEWTDFNTHDPGITLLEQICYALSDLEYRIGYDVPDLLSNGGADPHASLHPPEAILTMHPVTPDDLRRLALDVEGVRNAWIELGSPDSIPLAYIPGKKELRLGTQDLSAQPIPLRGLYRVFIDPSGEVDETLLQGNVAKVLHAHRAMCEDFAEITVLKMQPIQVEAIIEVAPIDDPMDLMLRIREALVEEISPRVPFSTLTEMIAAGYLPHEIFEGPRLHHGFLSRQALADASRPTVLHTSDLMHVINSVSGVRAVSRVRIAKGGAWEEWSLPIDADRIGKLDPGGLKLTLRRSGQVIVTDPLPPAKSVRTAAVDAGKLASANPLAPPRGRDRKVGKYSSMQKELPNIYGIGEMGLPNAVSPARRAQARQLKAYLLFFDQLLANAFAQLANVKELFSYESGDQTYFTQAVDGAGLGLEEVRTLDDAHRTRLQKLVETAGSAAALERKSRFLNHLLARFSEPIADQALASNLALRTQQKQTLLRHYPRLSSARGTGYNCLRGLQDSRSGLEERVLFELGLRIEDGEQLIAVEHPLLRPMKEDVQYDAQGRVLDLTAPLLALARQADPYSLQVTFALPDGVGRFAKPEFKLFVEETLRHHMPAHLSPYIYWVDPLVWPTLKSVHADWLRAQQLFTASNLNVKTEASGAANTTVRAINLRGARDRVIDLLGLGQTYPLPDTGVRPLSLTVDFGGTAEIEINPSQLNVRYELYEGTASVGPSYVVDGNGGPVVITGPEITTDHTYRVRAYKIDQPTRSTFLLTPATIKIGLNHGLPVTTPYVSSDTPVVDYGSVVELRVGRSQPGVTYWLIDEDDADISAAHVIGNSGEIALFTVPLLEDLVVRIKATRAFEESEDRPGLETIMDTAVPLAVRANPNVALSVNDSPICEYGATATISIAQSQSSVVYTAYVRSLLDADFVPTATPSSALLIQPISGAADVQVVKPARPDPWQGQAGFVQLAQHAGTDGLLELQLPQLTEDSVVVVQAHKDHSAVALVTSDLQLVQPLLILVRPAPVPELSLSLTTNADGTSGELSVTGGQPGVFYFFRRDSATDLIGLGAYFHEIDDSQPSLGLNKGIELLRLEDDFVLAREQTEGGDLTILRPLNPIVSISPLPTDNTLHVTAVKGRTHVAWSTGRTITVTAAP